MTPSRPRGRLLPAASARRAPRTFPRPLSPAPAAPRQVRGPQGPVPAPWGSERPRVCGLGTATDGRCAHTQVSLRLGSLAPRGNGGAGQAGERGPLAGPASTTPHIQGATGFPPDCLLPSALGLRGHSQPFTTLNSQPQPSDRRGNGTSPGAPAGAGGGGTWFSIDPLTFLTPPPMSQVFYRRPPE